jgi:hypothetical protein
MKRHPRLRSLYVCYLSLADPLVHTQVVAYLRGLAAYGHCIHLLTFETGRLTRRRRRQLRDIMSAEGISWHGMRYHQRPSLPATMYDTLLGAIAILVWSRRYRLDVVHARAHVPAAMALIARSLIGRRPDLVFDIRGLMAEEYVDAGRWSRGGVPFRLTKAVERKAIRRADGTIVLTNRIRGQLFGANPRPSPVVIPCCANIEALRAASVERDRVRAELGLSKAPVMIYVGKFGGWYMAPEMADFFVVARESIAGLHFLILTQGERGEIRQQLERHHVGEHDYTIASAPPERLGGYLAAADFGISFIQPVPSKAASSPTKVGEYLGAGLPVVYNEGIGDLDDLLSADVGVRLAEHSTRSHRDAAAGIVRLLDDPLTSERCRALAEQSLSLERVGIPRYLDLYEALAADREQASAAELEKALTVDGGKR